MKYLRLYIKFVSFSLSRALQFRFDFWFRISMDTVYYILTLALYKTLYGVSNTIGGFTEHQAMIFVGAVVLVDAIQMTIFSNGLWWIPTFVNRGDLDYYLVRPVSTLFFLSFRDFAVSSFINLVMASGILSWALWSYPVPISWTKLVYGLMLTANGVYLFYLVRVLLILPVFWTVSGTSLQHIFISLREVMERPDGVYTGWIRRAFVTILPFSLMASFPTHAFFESFDIFRLGHILTVTIGLTCLVLFLWNKGLKVYSSASS